MTILTCFFSLHTPPPPPPTHPNKDSSLVTIIKSYNLEKQIYAKKGKQSPRSLCKLKDLTGIWSIEKF